MNKRNLKNTEWMILIISIMLFIIGVIALYSCTQSTGFEDMRKQLIWFVISIPILIVFIVIDYSLISRASYIIYGIFLILLIAVFFTQEINGATSWFNIGGFSFQPGEFSKVFVIIFFSTILCKFQEKGKNEINKFWKLIVSLLIIIVPVILIMMQPDIGTAVAFIVSTMFILFVAGIDKKYIITSLLLIVILIPLAYMFVLPEHAKSRIDVYMNPNLDPRGAGYNIIQSKLAVGAGQVFGMGILKGNQTQLGFLYPKTTDFIFAVIGEEMGFCVSTIIIILYVLLLTKCIHVAKTAKDDLGSYIATGLTGILFFHVLENIGMTIGLLPITGVPLPFISYGGSSLITNFICIGILLNISARRQKSIF